MHERRMFERISIPLEISYEVIEKLPAQRVAASEDISGGGIRLTLNENLPVGANLKLRITLPDSKQKTATAYGKVVWTSKKSRFTRGKTDTYFESGVQFTSADPIIVGRIFKYFEARSA